MKNSTSQVVIKSPDNLRINKKDASCVFRINSKLLKKYKYILAEDDISVSAALTKHIKKTVKKYEKLHKVSEIPDYPC